MGDCIGFISDKFKSGHTTPHTVMDTLVRHLHPIQVKKGVALFQEQEILDGLYLIKSGAFKYTKTDGEQDRITRLLGPGDFMGKRSVISDKGAYTSATALMDSQVCYIRKKHLNQLLDTEISFAREYLGWMMEDMDRQHDDCWTFCSGKPLKKRLATLLVYLAEKYGLDPKGKLLVRFKREDMATFLGTSQEYIIHLLAHLKSQKSIDLVKRDIYIHSLAELRGASR